MGCAQRLQTGVRCRQILKAKLMSAFRRKICFDMPDGEVCARDKRGPDVEDSKWFRYRYNCYDM